MTESHTPGPWSVEPRFRYGTGFAGAGCLPIVGGNAVICAIGQHDPYMPQDANARLIAAAPDMLAALRAALEALKDAYHLGDIGDFKNGVTDSTGTIDEGDVLAGRVFSDLREAIKNTQAAIAKATRHD